MRLPIKKFLCFCSLSLQLFLFPLRCHSQNIPENFKAGNPRDKIIVFDWNNDGAADSFILKAGANSSEYLSFIIKVHGQPADSQNYAEGEPALTDLNGQYTDPEIVKRNLTRSDVISFFRAGNSASAPVLLYICGIGSAEFPEQYLYAIKPDGKLKLIFDQNCDTLSLLTDDKSGNFEFLVYNSDSNNLPISDSKNDFIYHLDMGPLANGIIHLQNKKSCFIHSYQAVSVYRLDKDNELQKDMEKTISETRKRNYGLWCNCSAKDQKIIIKNAPRAKPVLMDFKKAVKIWNSIN